MKKWNCIIWGHGRDYDNYINAIKLQEMHGAIKVIGITAKDKIRAKRLDGYPVIDKEDLKDADFDIVIVASLNKFAEIQKSIMQKVIDDMKIVSIRIFSIPNLNFDKYIEIKNSKLSIFSNCCWGGITYNKLGMQFYSPFINMFLDCQDYLKILGEPKKYMNSPMELVKYAYAPKRLYPVCDLNGVRLHFNHYSSYVEALELWEKRKERINWDNIFIMMYTEDKGEAEMFTELKHKKKVCFVPFETTQESLFYIDREYLVGNDKDVPFYDLINGLAWGMYKYYDILDLLLGDKNKTRLI